MPYYQDAALIERFHFRDRDELEDVPQRIIDQLKIVMAAEALLHKQTTGKR